MCDDPLFYIGPEGKTIRLDHLPRRGLARWRPRDKAMIVASVRRGSMSLDEAFRRYGLSIERYLCWYQCYAPQAAEDG